jgi:hypothetical protein
MKAYKLDKNYTPEKEANRRKFLKKTRKNLQRPSARSTRDAEAAKVKVILEYLKKPQNGLAAVLIISILIQPIQLMALGSYLEGLSTFVLKVEEETQNRDCFNQSCLFQQ